MRGAREHNSPGAESPWGRRLTGWSAEKTQHCHKHFLQYRTFASERPQVETWGRQTCLLSRRHLTLLLYVPGMGRKMRFKKLYMKILIFAKQFLRPPSKWRPWHVPCLPYPRYASGNISLLKRGTTQCCIELLRSSATYINKSLYSALTQKLWRNTSYLQLGGKNYWL